MSQAVSVVFAPPEEQQFPVQEPVGIGSLTHSQLAGHVTARKLIAAGSPFNPQLARDAQMVLEQSVKTTLEPST